MPTIALNSESLKSAWYLLGGIIILIGYFAGENAFAGQANLAWNSSTGPVAGYRIYYGNTSGQYTANMDAGSATTATVPNLQDSATYYFAVKAYDAANNESPPSNEVKYTVATTSNLGGSSSANINNTATISAPIASFNATPTSGLAPLLVTLTDSSAGPISSRVWDFGDGTTSTSQTAVKTYNAAGIYTVKLTVKNATSSSTISKTISVNTAKPTANFSATPTSGSVPLTVKLTDASTDTTSWAWNFGDGTTSNLQTPPAHTYKAAGTYTVSLTTKGPGGVSTTKALTITAKSATSTTTLPRPWLNKDIGNVGVPGSAGYTNGVFTLKGSGVDIWYQADSFQFAYQPLSGDATIVARVTSVNNTDSWAKAGIMIRETLDPSSRNAMIALTPTNGIAFQRRLENGSHGAVTMASGLRAPYWIKLVRNNLVFSAYHSADGNVWTLMGSVTINMAANAYVGLALSSRKNTVLTTALFNNVAIQ